MTLQQIRQKARNDGGEEHHPAQEGQPDQGYPGARGECALLQGHRGLLGRKMPLERGMPGLTAIWWGWPVLDRRFWFDVN